MDDPKFLVYKPRGGRSVLLDFDAQNIQLSLPIAKQGNTRVSRVSYLYNGVAIPFRVQFPKMSSPFQLSNADYNGVSKNYYQFSISFYGEDSRPDMQAFRAFLGETQERLIEILHENSADWFASGNPSAPKRAKSLETIQENFAPIIKDGWSKTKNRQYDDNLPLKCSTRGGIMQTVFFNDEEQPQVTKNIEDIDTQQAEVLVLAELRDLWIVNQYHAKFEALQVQVFPQNRRDENYGFVGHTEEEEPEFDMEK